MTKEETFARALATALASLGEGEVSRDETANATVIDVDWNEKDRMLAFSIEPDGVVYMAGLVHGHSFHGRLNWRKGV